MYHIKHLNNYIYNNYNILSLYIDIHIIDIDNIINESDQDDSSEDETRENNDSQLGITFKDHLITMAIDKSLNGTQITALLKLFRKHNIGGKLPLSSRTLLSTPRNIETRIISNMDYYYFGVKKQIVYNLETNYPNFNGSKILLSMNIDGIPFYKSTKHSCWPILMSCNIKPTTVFLVTITYGQTKPKDNEFLREAILEIKELMESGLYFFKRRI